ncbi:MAG: galactokinase [Anaerolineales bacterium]|nr:galactokinase [Anaerolineales bacterium]
MTPTMQPIEQIAKIFKDTFGHEPAHIARAPGRVNLLGEHVDYNGGFVLPAAIDRATFIAFAPSTTLHSSVLAVDLNQSALIAPSTISEKTQPDGTPLPDWAHYPAGVMWSLLKENLAAPNLNAVFASDVPRGAGLSSSASVEMAFAVAWQTLGGWTLPPMQLALLAQQAENEYVGVKSGIMDQFASACGVEGKLLLLDCRSLEWKTLPLPEHISIVIADTAVRRKLTSGEYNNRRAACEEAVKLLQNHLPEIKSLRDVSVEDFNRLANTLPHEAAMRARHVVEEIARARQAEPALEAGNIQLFGALMNACHVSLRDLYEVSCPELETMVAIAQALEGCYGARLTGAGFGGCTVNLVEKNLAEKFSSALAKKYEDETGIAPGVFITHPSAGASLL